MADPNPILTIIYTLKLTPANKRVTLDLHRDDFKAPLGYFQSSKQIKWLQPAYEFLFDKDDLKALYKSYLSVSDKPVLAGGLELGLFSSDNNSVSIKYGEDVWAVWTPEKGLKCLPGSPSWLKKDVKPVALACTEIPVGRGLGVFSGTRAAGI